MSTIDAKEAFLPNFEFGPHHREAWTRQWTGSSQEAALDSENQLLRSHIKQVRLSFRSMMTSLVKPRIASSLPWLTGSVS
jgi:hypothetical protein